MVPNLLFTLLFLVVAVHVTFIARKVLMVRREADEAWARRDEEGGIEIRDIDEAGFKRAYFRAYGPRGALHAYLGVVLAVLLTMPALSLLGGIWRIFWRMAGEPRAYAPGNLPWQFYVFFGLTACWVIVAHLVIRRYHLNRPRELRVEMARERAKTEAAP